MKKLLLLLLVCAGVLPVALGQTGRIARLSHSGRLIESTDNFGDTPWMRTKEEEIADSVVYLNDTLATVYERYRYVPKYASAAESKQMPWQLRRVTKQYHYKQYQHSWEVSVKYLSVSYPQAKLVGFDKRSYKPSKQKPAGRTQAFPRRPFQYSYWRELTAVVAVGAVGWLLGRKPKTV